MPAATKSTPAPPARVSWVVVGAGLAATAAQTDTVPGPTMLWETVVPDDGGAARGASRVIRSPSTAAMWVTVEPTVKLMLGPQRKVLPAPLATEKLVVVAAGLFCTVELVVSVRPMSSPITTTTAPAIPESTR